MKCDEIMMHGPLWCVPTDAVATVAKAMNAENLDSVPVCKSHRNRHLVGIINRRVLTNQVATKKVQSVMTQEPVACNGDDDLGVALDAMHRNRVQRVPVVSDAGELIGVITLADAILWSGEPKGIVEVITAMTQGRHADQSRAKTAHAESGKPKVRYGGAGLSF